MTKLQSLLTSLSSLAPDVFQAEVAAGLAYAVVLFHLNISDTYRAALIGTSVLAFGVLQAVYRSSKATPAK